MLTEEMRLDILDKAKLWFKDVIAENHVRNTKKLNKASAFHINPFLVTYLATFLDGDYDETSIAKALIYPRALGTSITTSFGQNMQGFVTKVLTDTFGSVVAGIDIEFTDQVTQEKKYCQVKLGPNTINKDDVITIHDHFRNAKNLAKTNNNRLVADNFVVAILYGEEEGVSTHYKRLRDEYDYSLLVGKTFWHHLTGDEEFYDDLIEAISSTVQELKANTVLDNAIKSLAKQDAIKKIAQK